MRLAAMKSLWETALQAKFRAIARAVCGTILLLLAFSLPAWPQQSAYGGTQLPAVPDTSSPSTPALAPKAKIADFAWLEGRWRGEWGPRIAEQTWFAPQAGVLEGIFRVVENDKTLVIELFTLVEKPEGINFYFRHFTPDLVPWEKSDATLLKLSSFDPKKIDFENPVNGLPKHAILIRLDADTFISRSEIVPDQGDPQAIEITYHRLKPAPEKTSPARAH